MRSNLQNILGLSIALCLGFTWACVKVDVSIQSSATNRSAASHYLPPDKPSISIEQLKERHTHTTRNPSCQESISLNINRDKQQTRAWCWAASARTVMDHHNKGKVPPEPTALQCDIVKNVFGPLLDGTSCCQRRVSRDFIDAPPMCVQGGWPHWILDNYQFNYEWVKGPFTDWKALKDEICTTGPFISVIEWREGGKHTLIVKGYRESPGDADSERVIEVYDPIQDDPQDVTFEEFIRGSLKGQDVLYEFSHDRTYVQIVPEPEDQS